LGWYPSRGPCSGLAEALGSNLIDAAELACVGEGRGMLRLALDVSLQFLRCNI
jgi:hypothetical protein